MTGELQPIHPGEVLAEEFLAAMGISQYRLAKGLGVPPRRVNEIVLGKRGITADTALRLSRFFGTTAEFWMNLQVRYDLENRRGALGRRLDREVEVNAPSRGMRMGEVAWGAAGPQIVGRVRATWPRRSCEPQTDL